MAYQLIAAMLVLSGIATYDERGVRGPMLSFFGCILWLAIAVSTGLWGMAALNLILAILHARNCVARYRSANE